MYPLVLYLRLQMLKYTELILLCFIWVQNSVSYIKGRTWAEDTKKWGVVDDLWA